MAHDRARSALAAHIPVWETRHQREGTLRPHRHGIAFATIVVEGKYLEVSSKDVRAYTAGSIVVHDATEEHADHFIESARCLNVELPTCYVNSQLDPNLRVAAESVMTAFYRDRRNLTASVHGFQARLRIGVQRPAAPKPVAPKPAWLQRVLEGFEWCDCAPLREAAHMAGVHPVQFSRAFHEHVGMTSNAYRRRERLRRASVLLLGTTASVVRIAHDCGFSDQSHLTRTFREAFALSPIEYRRIFAR
jgi:AraC family transcriptional regulator